MPTIFDCDLQALAVLGDGAARDEKTPAGELACSAASFRLFWRSQEVSSR
nr:hypothetical protein [Variovorax sp. J22P271]